jgi:hypothetical protein
MRSKVGNLAWIHENANFATCGNGVYLLYARKLMAIRSKLFERSRYRSTVSRRAPGRLQKRVRYLHDDGFRRFVFKFLMMRLHGLDDARIHAEFFKDAAAYFHMRARYFMVHSLADVMQQGTGASDFRVCAELFSEHAGDVRHLYGVRAHSGRNWCGNADGPARATSFGSSPTNTCLIRCLLAFFAHERLGLAAYLLDGLLDSRWLNTAVLDELSSVTLRYDDAAGRRRKE